MITFIRSFSELMAITNSRDSQHNIFGRGQIDSSPKDSDLSPRFVKSMGVTKVELPDFPKTIRHKWLKKKETLSKFFKDLDYNNQILSSYDLTLQERQNNNIYKDAA